MQVVCILPARMAAGGGSPRGAVARRGLFVRPLSLSEAEERAERIARLNRMTSFHLSAKVSLKS